MKESTDGRKTSKNHSSAFKANDRKGEMNVRLQYGLLRPTCSTAELSTRFSRRHPSIQGAWRHEQDEPSQIL